MTNQLALLDSRPVWQLDPATRERGRQGLAMARAALEATRPAPVSNDDLDPESLPNAA